MLLQILVCVCCRPVETYLRDLTPLFHADYLLPRTFLSVLSLKHVEEVFASMVVPPDACLANTFYFVNTEKYLTEKVFLPVFVTHQHSTATQNVILI